MQFSNGRRVCVAIGLFFAINACGGGNATPTATPVKVAPSAQVAAPESPPSAPSVTTTRPASLAAWVHVENVPAWMTYFGLKADASSDDSVSKMLGAGAAALDLTRPLDLAATFVTEDEVEGAAVIPIQSKEIFLTLRRQTMNVTERKSRYILTDKKSAVHADASDGGAPVAPPEPKKKKSSMDDKILACDFVASPAQAGCGTERGLTEIAPWLQSAPKPQKGDIAIEMYVDPLRKAMLDEMAKDTDALNDAPAADPETARKKAEEDVKMKRNAAAFVNELDRVALSISLNEQTLSMGIALGFRGTESAWVKPHILAPADGASSDLLFKLTENASAAMFSQGGGPLPELLSSYDMWSDLGGADHDKGVALTGELKKMLAKPWAVSYGIRSPSRDQSDCRPQDVQGPRKSKEGTGLVDRRIRRACGEHRRRVVRKVDARILSAR